MVGDGLNGGGEWVVEVIFCVRGFEQDWRGGEWLTPRHYLMASLWTWSTVLDARRLTRVQSEVNASGEVLCCCLLC